MYEKVNETFSPTVATLSRPPRIHCIPLQTPVRELSTAQQRVGKGWNSAIRRGHIEKLDLSRGTNLSEFIRSIAVTFATVNFSRGSCNAAKISGVEGNKNGQNTERSRPALSSFFLQRSTCYRSCFGGNRTPINRLKIFGSAEFTADVWFFRRFAWNRAASRNVEPSSSWKFVGSAPRAIMRFDRDDDDGYYADSKRGKKGRIKRVVRGYEIVEGSVSAGGNGYVCFIQLIARSSLRKCCRSLRSSIPQSSLSIRENKSYRFTDVSSCIRTFP